MRPAPGVPALLPAPLPGPSGPRGPGRRAPSRWPGHGPWWRVMHQRGAHPAAGHRFDVEAEQPVVAGPARDRVGSPHPRPPSGLDGDMLAGLIGQGLVRCHREDGDAVAAVFVINDLGDQERRGGVLFGGADHHRGRGPVGLLPRLLCGWGERRPGVFAEGCQERVADGIIRTYGGRGRASRVGRQSGGGSAGCPAGPVCGGAGVSSGPVRGRALNPLRILVSVARSVIRVRRCHHGGWWPLRVAPGSRVASAGGEGERLAIRYLAWGLSSSGGKGGNVQLPDDYRIHPRAGCNVPYGRNARQHASRIRRLRAVPRPQRWVPDRRVTSQAGAIAADYALRSGESPSSTVAIARWENDRVDALVLGDSAVVAFGTSGEVEKIQEPRIHAIPNHLRSAYFARLRTGAGFGSNKRELLRAHNRCGRWAQPDRALTPLPCGLLLALGRAGALGQGLVEVGQRKLRPVPRSSSPPE